MRKSENTPTSARKTRKPRNTRKRSFCFACFVNLFCDRPALRRPNGRRDPFLGRDRPVEVGRLHGKKERAWILADVGRVASHASRVDREDERSSADVAVD